MVFVRKGIRDFNWVLNHGHFDKLRESTNDVFLVDTGVFIDLESYYHCNSRNNSNGHAPLVNPATLLGMIEIPLIITPFVSQEIANHREMVIGRRYEISQSTSLLANTLYEESIDLFAASGIDSLSRDLRDFHRYQATLAAYEVFDGDSRKGEKDKISDTDKGLITTALDLCHCFFKGEPIGTVNILSPDEHIPRTVKTLKGLDSFKKYGIRAIPTRTDLRSYLK
jgi:hypothetical protein